MAETSPKQIEANQQNAQQSTGPKTDEGKAVSRYNALKHGLLSKEVLLSDESEDDLVGLGKKLRAELGPETEFELVLVDRMIANIWRLRRAMRIEKEMIDEDRVSDGYLGTPVTKSLGGALSYDFAHNDTYGKLIRYEASIERGIYKALHELQRLQAARNGQSVPAPIVIDLGDDRDDGFVS